MDEWQLFSSWSPYEETVGYPRAGSWLAISGTTASSQSGPVGGADAGAQAREVLGRIARVLEQAGAGVADVVRTRVYLTDIADFEAVAQAHGQVFGAIRPATTFVQVVALVDSMLVVEIEADAFLRT